MAGENFELFETESDDGPRAPRPPRMTDKQIETHFNKGRLRVIQEKNDFFLPHIVDFIKGRKWGNLRPEYQRRLRWSAEKKSRLIESFLMNVPVPPVFLYEDSSGKYEVMDGQQRINCVVEFLSGAMTLEKLKIWPLLNGRTFETLPPSLRRGLERSKLSAITLITDDNDSWSPEIDVRSQVFDRLNTGGEKLNAQELRNCLYSGPFNQLVVELAALPIFTEMFDIPNHKKHTLSDGSYDEILKENKVFSTMTDCQIVLRFFAFRENKHLKGSVKSMLDECMKRYRFSKDTDIEKFGKSFVDAIKLAKQVFGKNAFRLPPTRGKKEGTLSRPLFDALMIALSRHADSKAAIVRRKVAIAKAVADLCKPNSRSYELIVGRANTADAIRKRIALVEKILTQ